MISKEGIILLDVLHASVRLTYKAFGTFILKSYRETINGSCNGLRFLNNQRQSIYSAKHSNDLHKRFIISLIMSCLTDKTEKFQNVRTIISS